MTVSLKRRKYFGDDGIQGVTNDTLTPEFLLRLGLAAGIMFRNGGPRQVLIGKDPRRSSYMIEYLLTGAFASVGMKPLLCGPIPTPGVALLAASMRADLGVMITGSGETFERNGIKLFAPDGSKLSEEQEQMLETMIDETDIKRGLADPNAIGPAKRIDEAQGRYVELAKKAFPSNFDLDGIRMVIDCANGATFETAPRAFEELGAEVVVIGNHPDGFNINVNRGYSNPSVLTSEVYRVRADIGIALNGDGEHVLVVDELRQKFDDPIMDRYTERGDGLVTAINILAAMRKKGQKASEIGHRAKKSRT